MSIRLLIADDHRLILQAIRRALREADDIEIVGEARTGSQVLPLISQTKPDLVLLDIRMPELDGFGCLARIRKTHPGLKVVVLSAFNDAEHVQGALSRGACAYIAKSVDPVELPEALRRAIRGDTFELGLAEPDDNEAGLTEREISMLRAVARGLSNQAISQEFWVTEQTVKFHLTNIYRKLGVANRTEAAQYVFSQGLAETRT